jgi:hypothetical protein
MWRRISAKTLLAFLGEVVLSGATPAAPLPKIGDVVTMDVDFFGCRSLDDLAHVVNLDWVQKDTAASNAYGKAHCVVLHQGDQLRVQDLSSVQGAVCLRPTGSASCYWTTAQALKGP